MKVDSNIPKQWRGGGTNPAPLILPNGTVFVMTRYANQRTLPNGSKQHYQNINLFRSESWRSEWTWVRGSGEAGALPINFDGSAVQTEDPTLWKGRRGYHALFHELSHAWSPDAIQWYWEPNATAQTILSWNGRIRKDHERPRMIVDENGDVDILFMSSILGPEEYSGTAGKDASQLLAMKASPRIVTT